MLSGSWHCFLPVSQPWKYDFKWSGKSVLPKTEYSRFLEEEILSACAVVFGRRKPGTVCLCLLECFAGEVETFEGRKIVQRLRDHLRHFGGSVLKNYLLNWRVDNLSTPTERSEYTRIRTFMHEHADAQTSRAWGVHMQDRTHTDREVNSGGTHQQAITQNMHPPAHTHLLQSRLISWWLLFHLDR